MTRSRHPKKEIEEAVAYAEAKNWTWVKPGKSSHAWGRLKCPKNGRDGCLLSVWSTPRSPQDHARDIIRAVDRCPTTHGDDDEV